MTSASHERQLAGPHPRAAPGDSSAALRNQRRRRPAETNWRGSDSVRSACLMLRVILPIVALALSGVLAQATQSNASTTISESGTSTANQAFQLAYNFSGKPSSTASKRSQNGQLSELSDSKEKQPQKKHSNDQSTKALVSTSNNSSEAPQTSTTSAPPLPSASTANSTTEKITLLITDAAPHQPASAKAPRAASNRGRKRDERLEHRSGEPAGDLAAASSSPAASTSKQTQQLKRSPTPTASSSAASANKWTHFGARLKPLTVAGVPPVDYHHEAASSSSKARATLADLGQHRAQPNGVRKQAAPLQGNTLDGPAAATTVNQDEEEDDDDMDSEALLYKMMQQQSFLMNPNFQEQQPSGGSPVDSDQQPARARSEQAGSANAAADQTQKQHDDNMAKSRRVIKLLKSYSHIHQVDDSDDQIRGAHYPRPQQSSSGGNQYLGQQQRQLRPINKSGQHIFISSRPVTTSQSRATTRVYADDGQYRPDSAQPSADESGRDPAADDPNSNNGGPPAEEEDDFECPNNGIFADVASGCQAYHVCQSASQVQQRFQCPLGTLFNDIILTCDFAHNVQCGKKPGELGSALAPSLNQQQQQQVNQPAGVAAQPQYSNQASAYSHQQQAPRAGSGENQVAPARPQTQQYRPSGPRQLVIGSPYNLHNQQRPAQTLSAYPSVRPLSNSIGSSDDSGDEDDKEENEPLIPATLPPRVSALPYQAPPQATTQSLQQTSPVQSNSAQVSNPRQAYPLQQQRPRQPVRTQVQQQQRPRYQSSTEATPASSYEASAAPPTFVEPSHHRGSDQAAGNSSPAAGQTSDMQSYSLVINHMAPVAPSGRQLVQHQLPPAPISNYLQPQPQSQPQPSQTQRERPLVAVNKQTGQQAQVRKQAESFSQESGRVSSEYPKSTQAQRFSHQNGQQQQHQSGQTLRSVGPIAKQQHQPSAALQAPLASQRYESRREPSRQQQQQQQQTQGRQQQQLQRLTPVSTPASYEESAASQPTVSHRQQQGDSQTTSTANYGTLKFGGGGGSQQPRLQDLNDDVINDGVFLIIRHGSGSPLLQLGASEARTMIPQPEHKLSSDNQRTIQASSLPSAAHQVFGLLPPMEPPAPQPHDKLHNQRQQRQAVVAPSNQQQQLQYSSSNQIVSSATTTPAATGVQSTTAKTPSPSSAPRAPSSSAPVSSTTTERAPQATQDASKILARQPQQKSPSPRVKRTRRIKPAASPPKAGDQKQLTSSTTSATPTSTTPASVSVASTSDINRNVSERKRKQQA